MNAMIHHAALPPGEVTMTSLELVNYINGQRGLDESELRHDHFMTKVPHVLGGAVAPNFRAYYKGLNGKQNVCYRFPKREACLMAMSYSYELQARVFDHMTALETRIASVTTIPQTLPEALRLAADMAEQKAKTEAALAVAALKAEALDRIADADGLMTPTDAAKTLQVQPKKLFDFLRENRWIYSRSGSSTNVAYQDKIQAGLLTHKSDTIQRKDGTDKVVHRVLVTAKGLAKLSQAFGRSLAGE